MLKVIELGEMGLCNKLFFLLHIVASAHIRAFKVELYDMYKIEGIALSSKEIDAIVIKHKDKMKGRTVLKTMSLVDIFNSRSIRSKNREDAMNIFLNYTRKDMFQRKDFFFWGWPYLDYYAVKKDVDLMRSYFRFSSEILKNSEEMINRKNNEFIIGVHLRRGDYKTWNNGKYYFDDNTYKSIIDSVYKQIGNCYKIRALIFSNEEIDEKFWSNSFEFPVVVSRSSSIKELCMLSLCDLIIGPPSTYSGWASFVGNTPKYNIMTSHDIFKFEKTFICFYDKDGFGNDIDRIFDN